LLEVLGYLSVAEAVIEEAEHLVANHGPDLWVLEGGVRELVYSLGFATGKELSCEVNVLEVKKLDISPTPLWVELRLNDAIDSFI